MSSQEYWLERIDGHLAAIRKHAEQLVLQGVADQAVTLHNLGNRDDAVTLAKSLTDYLKRGAS